MAYDATVQQPNRITGGTGANSSGLWIYQSADAHTDVDAAGYFTNGDDLGLKTNDSMIVIDTATPTCTIHHVATVTAGGAATITVATLA